MEAQIYSFSRQIKEKIENLFNRLDKCEGIQKKLEKENADLRNKIKIYETKIKNLETAKFDDSIKIFNQNITNKIRKEMVETVDEAIRAIDRAIRTLSENGYE